MTNSIEPLSHKEKFIEKMNEIIKIRDQKSKTISVKTKHNNISHYIQVVDYIDCLCSNCETLGNIKVSDIVSIGFKPPYKDDYVYLNI